MKKTKRSRNIVLISLLVCSMVGTNGCGWVAGLGASFVKNPAITAAIIAMIPAITMTWSNHSASADRLEVEKLQAETARINALTTNAEKMSQQRIEQRKLELELIKEKRANANNPEATQELEQLEAGIQEDKRTVEQTLDTAATEADKLADDQNSLLPTNGSGASGK